MALFLCAGSVAAPKIACYQARGLGSGAVIRFRRRAFSSAFKPLAGAEIPSQWLLDTHRADT